MSGVTPEFSMPPAQGLHIVRDLDELRAGLDQYRSQASENEPRRVVLVPTMGNLHEGHLALVRRARELGELVIASIFVNPFQFAPNEDFDSYPRTFEHDVELLVSEQCDVVFAPDGATVYPRGPDEIARVTIPDLGDVLCGASRPGFFRGVTTVVNILLNMVQPDFAVFGEKDYQQLMLVRRMVADLRMRVQIESIATVRESDGLAMSSRNGYLSADERARAPTLYRTLCEARDALLAGELDFDALRTRANASLSAAGLLPDYFEIRRQADLGAAAPGESELVVLVAAHLGAARLIDNICV